MPGSVAIEVVPLFICFSSVFTRFAYREIVLIWFFPLSDGYRLDPSTLTAVNNIGAIRFAAWWAIVYCCLLAAE